MTEVDSTVISNCVRKDLERLRIPVYKTGYEQLCVGIMLFAEDTAQAMCCELYPAIAKVLGGSDWRAVEFAIRRSIHEAWNHRDAQIWEEYFPGIQKVPTNKQFIATLALRIK